MGGWVSVCVCVCVFVCVCVCVCVCFCPHGSPVSFPGNIDDITTVFRGAGDLCPPR